MGKTYVALAVPMSVLEATRRKRPVVVMVPPAVADKWPTEWAVFAERCLPAGHGLRASPTPIRRGSDFLKLLDDPASTRRHLIFLTHGALTSNLHDPFMRLALLRRAMLQRRDLANRRRARRPLRRLAAQRQALRRGHDRSPARGPRRPVADSLGSGTPRHPLGDDPVPFALEQARSRRLTSRRFREALAAVPLRRSASFTSRIGPPAASSTWP